MAQPDGFIDPKDLNRVCKLKRSIYGLKQAYHIRNLFFHEKVKELKFCRSKDDSYVYIKASGIIVFF